MGARALAGQVAAGGLGRTGIWRHWDSSYDRGDIGLLTQH